MLIHILNFVLQWQERERKANEEKDRKNGIIIGVHAILGAASIGAGIAAACMGHVYAIVPAFSAAMVSAHKITDSAVELGDNDSPSTSQDHDCDKSD